MYLAVINMDDGTVVSIEPSAQSAQDTVQAIRHPRHHLIEGVRTTLVMPVDESIWLAYSHGKALEFVIDDHAGIDNWIDSRVEIVKMAA
jgi:hypothetical protein